MQFIDSYKGWLSIAIGGFKSAVTKFANENGIEFAWQTRFHDRIIRNQEEMNRIADYIENIPARWDMDCFNQPETYNVETLRATSLHRPVRFVVRRNTERIPCESWPVLFCIAVWK
jgi:hypothetical protein